MGSPPPQPAGRVSSREAPATVLVVDDHLIAREGLISILGAMAGVSVVGQVGTAEDALEAMARVRPDLVLLDFHLPGRDGIEACPQLLAAHPGARVLVLTQFPASHLVRKALEAGAFGFVAKRSGRETLAAAIRSVLAGERFVDPAVDDTRGLTARELDVLARLAHGDTTRGIAERLDISTSSVQTYVGRAIAKLGATNRAAAIAEASRRGLI